MIREAEARDCRALERLYRLLVPSNPVSGCSPNGSNNSGTIRIILCSSMTGRTRLRGP
ncbi:hypothetical protein LJK88_49520 [Paenibacillus sp. P26]|nr:hypothetical protein LJK88_49520 [Paenibacillus sp. P26]